MSYINKLTNILLSDNVVNNFHKAYNNDSEFKNQLLQDLPEIEDCKNQVQDNPWHIHDCLNHLLHSVMVMNTLSIEYDEKTRKMLAYVMFLHDIGKPACHIRRFAKNYGREVDSFFNHNIKSAEITHRFLSHTDFEDTDKKIIEKLVYNHDIFMFIRLKPTNSPHRKVLTEELFAEKLENLDSGKKGPLLMEYLLKVGWADSSAQNPEMTQGSFEVLNAMQAMLEKYKKKEKQYENRN